MKKVLLAVLPVALAFGCVGCKREAGTIDNASKEDVEEMVGNVDAPNYDELDQFLDSHHLQNSNEDKTEETSSSFSFHLSF